MHLGRPLNVQWLPLLETLMTSQLNTSIGPHHRAEVRVWNFDPDGWVVNFFVILRSEPMLWLGYVLDARLPYAASIYRKLEGLQLRLPSASAVYMLMTYVVDDISKRVVRERAFRDCEGEDKWLSFPVEEQECPLQKNFTLYVEWLSEYPHRRYLQNGFVKVQPNADKILDAVQQAFAIANPVTMDNIVLTISLTDRDDSLRTTIGRDAFKLSFALSYPKMKSGLYWKLWRYPSYDELNGLLQSVAEVKLVRTWTVAIPVSN
ncbi:uncharacterized protein LOC129589682 [Paramacrobiotus metropolitanus]|nr:uncharacterized protein LOC129589682 [Paramacrobiotus metropolitanus]